MKWILNYLKLQYPRSGEDLRNLPKNSIHIFKETLISYKFI